MIRAVFDRRSIRKYTGQGVSEEMVNEILQAGMCAPSAKNRQPWKFIVVSGESKRIMLECMERGIQKENDGVGVLQNSKKHILGAVYSLRIMREAPVVVLVLNTLGYGIFESLGAEDRVYELANLQSIGAAMQNMTLTATDLGLGSLWICDIFFAYGELCDWLGEERELVAALTLGYPGENPGPRPRKRLEDVAEWKR